LPQWLPDQWKINHAARSNGLQSQVMQTT